MGSSIFNNIGSAFVYAAWTKRGEFNLVKRDQAASCDLGEKKLDFQHVKACWTEG